MLCKKPFIVYKADNLPVPCGQCMNCRINNLRIWTTRIEFEQKSHLFSAWATLTYSDENLPHGGELSKRHVQLFIKNIRQRIAPRKIRYYIVGEYGPTTIRPHYHAIIFGMDGTDYFNHAQRIRIGEHIPIKAKDDWSIIYKSWPYGINNTIGPLDKGGARYNLGYITRKLTRKNDPAVKKILGNRCPEFSLKSQGIGRDYAETIGKLSTSVEKPIYPIQTVNQGRYVIPVGRYCTEKINTAAGKTEILEAAKTLYKRQVHEKYSDQNPAKNVRQIVKDNKVKSFNQEYNYKLKRSKRSI